MAGLSLMDQTVEPHYIRTKDLICLALQKKDTSVTFWAELIFSCHAYDTSMTIIVTKPGIIIPSPISLPTSLFTRSVILHPTTNSLVTMLARLIVMSITERAKRYLSKTRSDKSNLDLCQPNKHHRRHL